MNRKIYLPEGTRDFLKEDKEEKTQFIKRIDSLLKKWNYSEIETPNFEYIDTFMIGTSPVNTDDMIKFISKDGEILTLISDMTIPIARVVSSKFKEEKGPLRFRYTSNTYSRSEKFSGKQMETTEIGAELIGNGSLEEDLEVLILVLESMKFLKDESFHVELGDVRFVKELGKYLEIPVADFQKITKLIDEKNVPLLEKTLVSLNYEEEVIELFNDLVWANGGKEVLKEMEKYAFNESLKEILKDLEIRYHFLEELGYGDFLQVNFSKIPKQDYYTSIIFEAYVRDLAIAVISGGRYNDLIELFRGDHRPAIGFAVKVDELMKLSLPLEKKEKIILYYPEEKNQEAFLKRLEIDSEKIVDMRIWEKDEIKICGDTSC